MVREVERSNSHHPPHGVDGPLEPQLHSAVRVCCVSQPERRHTHTQNLAVTGAATRVMRPLVHTSHGGGVVWVADRGVAPELDGYSRLIRVVPALGQTGRSRVAADVEGKVVAVVVLHGVLLAPGLT